MGGISQAGSGTIEAVGGIRSGADPRRWPGADGLRHRPPQPGHATRSRRRSATPSCWAGSTRPTTTSRSGSASSTPRRAGLLERSGAPEPEFLPHVLLRVRDVMQQRRAARRARTSRSARWAWRWRASDRRPHAARRRRRRAGRGDDRARARPPLRPRVARGVDDSDAPTRIGGDRRRARRAGWSWATRPRRSPGASGCWRWRSPRCPPRSPTATSSSSATAPTLSGARSRSASRLLVTSNGSVPDEAMLALAARARHGGRGVAARPYVTSRMITLSAPVARADGPRAAHRAPRRPRRRHRR